MAGPARKAGGPSKKGSKSRVTVLRAVDGVEVPPLPDARDWIAPPHPVVGVEELGVEAVWPDDESLVGVEVDWCEAVKAWWGDIWSSPMSGEFVSSDIHSLYLACYYLHESLNAFYRPSDRLAFGRQFQATIKDFGLTPSARESLRWQVAQGTVAQQRTDKARAVVSGSLDRRVSSDDVYSRFV